MMTACLYFGIPPASSFYRLCKSPTEDAKEDNANSESNVGISRTLRGPEDVEVVNVDGVEGHHKYPFLRIGRSQS